MKNVDTGGAFRFGWESVKKHFWYFVGLGVIYMVLTSGPGWKTDQYFFDVIGFIVGAWLSSGLLRIMLDFLDGKKREIADIFTQFQYLGRMLIANIFVAVIVMVGFIFLLVPGIYFGLRFQFVGYFIVDKNMGVGDAMKQSTELTKGIKWQLFWFALAMIGVMILGAICLGVGILVALPIVWLAQTFLYRALLKQSQATPAT